MKSANASHEEFEGLAMPLLDALYNFARWLSRDQAEAEDLVQETFFKGLRGFDSFTPGSDFRAWMFRILRNTFLTSRRKMLRQVLAGERSVFAAPGKSSEPR